jgi:hypothetical protein
MKSVAGARIIWLGVLVAVLIAGIPGQFGGMAVAGTVDIASGPQSGTNNVSGTNTGILVSPIWEAPPVGAEWISYGATGCNTFVALTGICTPGPDNPPGYTNAATPTAIFYQTFTTTEANYAGNLMVWADDTAGVWLDTGTVTSGNGSGGTMLIAPNFNQGSNCASGPIGCLPGLDGVLPLDLTTAGTYTLVFDAYQFIGGSPFGILYDATLTNTPEPASFLLMGLGLAGLGTLIRRRKRA